MTAEQLDALIGERDHLPFLNTRNAVYREKGFKENPPTRRRALELMAEHPNLIKRPIVVSGGEILLGFQPEAYDEL